MAGRLSENSWHTVLLIEAGDGYIPFTDMASAASVSAGYPGNYYYETERQSFNCLGFVGNVSTQKITVSNILIKFSFFKIFSTQIVFHMICFLKFGLILVFEKISICN